MKFKEQTALVAGAICNEEIREATLKLLLIFDWTESSVPIEKNGKIAKRANFDLATFSEWTH